MLDVHKPRYLATHLGLTVLLEPLMRGWHRALEPDAAPPSLAELRSIERRYRALLERDLENVARGLYPRDLLFQLSVGELLRKLPVSLAELPRIRRRRAAGNHRELPPLPADAAYPDYYLRTFHWQSGGWLTDRSAELYDTSVEALFLGTADVMRRMVIPPVLEATRGRAAPRVLDVACGTGRFLRQLARALPAAELHGLDLSPNYVAKAEAALRAVPGVRLAVANAEAMPYADEAFDVVTSIYLFHELPKDARRAVLREALRVLRPGGTLVLEDSAQAADGADIRSVLDRFPDLYHEPYYKGYLRDELECALREVGFAVVRSEAHFVSKVVVARKASASA